MRWIGFLTFVFLRTTASVLPRKALMVEDLCTNGAMRPVIQLSPSRAFPSAVSLTFGQSILPWRSIFFDCTLTFKIPHEDTNVALGLSFSHLQMRLGGPFECPDYIEMNDRSHALRLCGDMSGTQSQMPHFDSNSTSITMHVFSRSSASWQDDTPPFRFKLTIFAYSQVTKKSECIERGGVFCGSKRRCLPLQLVCNGFIQCDDITDIAQLQKNCSSGFSRSTRTSVDTKLAPITITVVASAIFLLLFILVVILLWMRKKFLARRCRTTSSQDLTEDASAMPVTDPMVYIINPSSVTPDSAGASQEIRYPSSPPPLLLTPTPSYSFVQANEAPPTYESLFGFSNNGLSVSGKQ